MTDTEPVKVYGYRRVSTEEQVDGMSMQNQENAIYAYAKTHNLEVVHIFHDDGYSAKDAKRPDLQAMLAKLTAKDNDVQGVVVYNLSRISRNMDSFYRDIGYHLAAHGVRLYSTVENIDDTPEGRLMRNVSLAMYQYDNDTKSKTVKDNMKLVALEGWWQGSIPYGFLREKIPIGEKNRDGKVKTRLTLLPDNTNDTASKIRQVLERFSKGDITQSELSQYAESIGLKSSTGSMFAPQSINNLLTNITYAGFICNKMTDFMPVNARHEGLISKDTYDRNQAILAGRKPNEAVPRFTMDYPLKHALLCSSCSKPLTGSAPTSGSGKSSPRYHCSRCRGTGSKAVDRIDTLFEAFLNEITPTDSMINLFRVIVRRTASQKLKDVNTELNKLRDEMSRLDTDIQKALQAFLDGDISKDEKESYQSDLRLKRIDIEGQIDKMEDAQRLNEATITYVCNFMNAPARMWKDADASTKVEFQKMVTENGITVDLKSEKFGTDGLSLFYRLKDKQKDSEESLDSYMVTHVDITWNSFLPYLINLTDKLEGLGFRYVDNEVMAPKEVTDEK